MESTEHYSLNIPLKIYFLSSKLDFFIVHSSRSVDRLYPIAFRLKARGITYREDVWDIEILSHVTEATRA